ncbi:diaminopimelate decarboxylase family protein [Lyngbya aestuarii]|uniref:diaminopimelate decarboxylase family protein n=1 Tax=Lyngbya aestuarii TaxID=118322 RepID=UPI00403DA907
MVNTQESGLTESLTTPFSAELAKELLANYGSPLYVYQSDRLRQTISYITQSILNPRTKFHFASVTNGNVALLQIFKNCGWGLHANTPGDVYLGIKAGFAPVQIVYSGSNLNRADLEQLLSWGVTSLNLDSVDQLSLFCEVYQEFKSTWSAPRLGLRLNLPELTGDSRIGVRPDEFSQAINTAKSVGLKLGGLHFYRGTGTNATQAFTQVITQILAVCQLLPDWEYLDFGGGFGYAYRTQGLAFNWQEFGRELSQHLENIDKKIELIIEPGRAAIAGCGTLLTQVVSVKWQEGKQVVGVDTTVANLSVPSVYGGYREIVTTKDSIDRLYPTDVCGNTTYSRDYLGRNCQLPALARGDVIYILDTGAYGYAMSSHFLHRPRPAEVLLENGTHKLIRQRENYGALLNNQLFNYREDK